jgi:hypothetical protein
VPVRLGEREDLRKGNYFLVLGLATMNVEKSIE